MKRLRLCHARKALWVGLWATAMTSQVTTGNADHARPRGRKACVASYEKSQQQRNAWKLRSAKSSLLMCARPACGKFIYRECTKSLAELDADMPSVVLLAKNDAGQPVVDVEVTLDGEPLTSQLDGRALSVDPGVHEFSFKTANGSANLTSVAIRQGERNRSLSVELTNERSKTAKAEVGAPSPAKFQPSVAAAQDEQAPTTQARASLASARAPREALESSPLDTPKSTGPGIGPYIVGGVGVAGLAGFGLLYTLARAENMTLPQCWPTCSEAKLDQVRRLYLAADVSLGVGVVALGTAAAWFYFGSGSSEKPAPTGRYTVGVQPSSSGLLTTVSGAF
jgi:hypothetical protein